MSTAAATAELTPAQRRSASPPGSGAVPPAMVGSAMAVALLTISPVALLMLQASTVGWLRLQQLLLRPLVGELLLNTLMITATATLAATVLGVGVAYCVERTDLPARQVWGVLAGLPIAVPAFVTSYSWVSLTPAVQGFGGAVLIVTLAYYPLVYLPVAAAFRGMDLVLEESARALGLGRARTFLRVVLPHARAAFLGGALVVAIHLLAEFGAFAMLRYRTFTTMIYDEYRLSFDGPAASILATVLVSVCVLLLLLEVRLRGSARLVRTGPGASRPMHRHRLGPLTVPVTLFFVGLVCTAIGVPVVTLGYWLTRASAGFQFGALLSAATASLGLASGAAILTTLMALPAAVLAVRFPRRLVTLLERSSYLAYSLPGITVALALIVMAVRYVRPLYQTTPLLMLAYAILFQPLALVAARAALAQAPRAVEEVARSLGCGPWLTFKRVTLPLITPGLGAGASLVLLFTLTELPATLLLAPIGTTTLATAVWSNVRSLAYGAAAPYAALMIGLSALPTYFLTRKCSAGVAALG